MKIFVKKLQGGECTIEVQPTTFISEVKRQVADQLKIPVEEQKLLFLGRTLVDEHTVQSYPTIKDGSKLNLLVRKPEGLYDVAYKSFKKAGMTDLDAKTTSKSLWRQFKKILTSYLGTILTDWPWTVWKEKHINNLKQRLEKICD